MIEKADLEPKLTNTIDVITGIPSEYIGWKMWQRGLAWTRYLIDTPSFGDAKLRTKVDLIEKSLGEQQ